MIKSPQPGPNQGSPPVKMLDFHFCLFSISCCPAVQPVMQITWLSTLQHFSNYKEFSLWSCHWCLTGRQKLCRHLKLHVSASHLHLAGKSRRLKKREWMILIISTGIMSMSVWAWYNGSPSQLQCRPLWNPSAKCWVEGGLARSRTE